MSIVSFALTWKKTKGKRAQMISAQIHSLLLSGIHSMTKDTLGGFQTGLSNWIDRFRKIKYLLKLGRHRHVIRCVVSSSIEPQLLFNSQGRLLYRAAPLQLYRTPSLDIFKLVKLGPYCTGPPLL